MLNIKDIQERLKRNPEPQEVKDIRNNILNSFNKLEFIEEGHKYYLHHDDGTVESLKSVSETCHQFEQENDWETITKNYAEKHNMTVEQVKRMWHENNIKATNNGTSTHLYGEQMMYFVMGYPEKICDVIKPQYEDGYLIPYSKKQEAIMKYYEDLIKIDEIYPVIPETQIYTGINDTLHLNHNYAGTFDMLFTMKINGEWKLMIHDWKGLPLDTPIFTDKGWKTMGTITTEDKVYDKNGILCNVLHTSSIHHKPCIKITFNNNDEIVCDEDHRWEITFMKNEKHKRFFSKKVMTGKELLEYHSKLDRNKTYLIPRIMVSKPIQNEEISLPIHPYVLGAWLGDGNKYDSHITNMYDELWKEIERCGYTLGNDVSQGGCGKAKTRNVNGFMAQARKCNLYGNKHIPDIFLQGSYKQRLALLQGLMDTDGYYNKTRKRYVMSTTQEWQKKATLQILSSLGIKATVIKAKGKCTNCPNTSVFDRWDICFATTEKVFRIRDIKPLEKCAITTEFRTIVDVKKCDTVPTRCIEVDSATHTFLCGYNFLVTHNTNCSLTSSYNQSKGITMKPPFDDLIDEAKNHYILQLSCYEMGLRQLGYDVIDRRLIHLKDDGTYDKIALPSVADRLQKVL